MRIILTISIVLTTAINCLSNTDSISLDSYPFITLKSETHIKYKKGKEYRTIRRRIKINTSKAIQDLSTFYFQKVKEPEITIQKRNGDTIKVEIANYVEVENVIPNYFSSLYLSQLGMKKMPLPNLEIGDIIDFTLTDVSTSYYGIWKGYGSYFESPIYRIPFDEGGPILKMLVTVKADDKWLLQSRLINEDLRNIKQYQSTFKVELENLNIGSNRKWDKIGSRKSLVYKLSVKNKNTYSIAFSQKSTLNPEEIISEKLKFLTRKSQYNIHYHRIQDAKKIIKEKYKKSPRGIRKDLYYLHQLYITNAWSSNTDADLIFICVYKYFLDKMKIDYNIGFTSKGDIKNVLSVEDLFLAIKVGDDLIFAPHKNTSFSEIPPEVEGSMLYLINEDSLTSKLRLPVSTPEENSLSSVVDVDVSRDFEYLIINDSVSKTGKSKSFDRELYLSLNEKIAQEDIYNLTGYSSKKIKNKRNRNVRRQKENERIENEKNALKVDSILRKISSLIEAKKSIKIDSLKGDLLQSGRLNYLSSLEHYNKYITKDLISKVGDYYEIKIGKIVGQQYQVEEDESLRSIMFENGSAESFNYIIRLKKPAGYSTIGYDNFNTNISNEVGSFKSVVTNKEKLIEVKCSAIFIKNKINSENIALFFEILEEINSFNEKSLMIKPKL